MNTGDASTCLRVPPDRRLEAGNSDLFEGRLDPERDQVIGWYRDRGFSVRVLVLTLHAMVQVMAVECRYVVDTTALRGIAHVPSAATFHHHSAP
jgi:hypothetical protein